ncbi:hypothetical protein NML43_19255 [Rhodopseudomonas palustris]|uniref:hypothetical protein n=1 Tax=Rhodopseudomonas palustris TaxID=1076 RepID=UPI0020CD3678|nr:hypothetical protein [Rhodopseudomonas palustris]MCP9629239.1 hypothetical protein [Rhodopseudomonas palustris]
MSTTANGNPSPDRTNTMMGSAAAFSESQATGYPPDGSDGIWRFYPDQQTGNAQDAGTPDSAAAPAGEPAAAQPDYGNGEQAASWRGAAQPGADQAQAGAPAGDGASGAADGASGGETPAQNAGAGDNAPPAAGGDAGAAPGGSANGGDTAAGGPIGSGSPIGDTGITDQLGLTSLANDVLSPLGGGTTLRLAGHDAVTQPVLDVANTAVLDLHNVLETLSHQTGTSDIVHGVTNLGETIGLGAIGAAPGADGNSNLLTDVLNLPGDALSGNLGGSIDHIGGDLSDVVDATFGLGNAVLNGADPLNPVPELINGLGGSLQSNPLLTLGGTDGAGGNGLLSGVVGDLSHSSSGHLVDVGVDGIDTPLGDGLALDLLSTPDGAASPIDVSALDVGPNGPQLIDLTLNGDSGLLADQQGGLGNVLDLDGLGQDLTDGALLSLNGGNTGAGLLGGDALNLNGSSTGHLVDANVDGTGTSPLVVDALAATGSGPQSPIDVNAVDVGPNGPQVSDVGVNTDAPALSLAPLAGGSDGLVGSLTQVTSIGAADSAPLSDLGSIEDVAALAPIGGDHGLLHLNGTQII